MLTDTYAPEQYDITGTVTDFPVGWAFFKTTDLKVTITSPAGVDLVLEEGSGTDKYTISAVNNDYSEGCTLTTGTEYGDGYQITIERDVPYGQELDINGDFIPGEPLEQALDKLAAQNQQTKDEIGRTLTIPATDAAGLTTEFPNAATRASKIASFDTTGALTVIDPVDSGTIVVDDTTIEQDGVTLQVKDGGISAAKLAADAVTTAKITDANVTTAKILDANVTTAKIADSNVTKAKIENVADMKVLGNVSGAAAAPAEVSILDEDNMASDSDTGLPTQQSVKAYVDASDTDGYTPTSYAGEEGVTLPNGLIMKFGRIARDGTDTSVTFESAFPTGILSAQVTMEDTGNSNISGAANVGSTFSVSGFNIRSGTGATHFNWTAIGY